jgi:hypothetical protein
MLATERGVGIGARCLRWFVILAEGLSRGRVSLDLANLVAVVDVMLSRR